MRKWFARILRRTRILTFDLLASSQKTFPDASALRQGEVVVVDDSGIKKWVCLLCPGGCGANISLSLNPERRPRWRVLVDFWRRPTVEPSVHQTNSCGCHFFIRRGCVEWCHDGRPNLSESGVQDAPLQKRRES